jgi:hypothetical protein
MRLETLEKHNRVLGWLYIALSAVNVLVAAMVFLVLVVPGLFVARGEPEAGQALVVVGIVLSAFLVLLAVPGLVGGIGLLRHQRWARVVVTVLGILNLFNFPLGTALGIYTLWFVMQSETDRLFEPPERQRLIPP